jgi:hypothetical protein
VSLPNLRQQFKQKNSHLPPWLPLQLWHPFPQTVRRIASSSLRKKALGPPWSRRPGGGRPSRAFLLVLRWDRGVPPGGGRSALWASLLDQRAADRDRMGGSDERGAPGDHGDECAYNLTKVSLSCITVVNKTIANFCLWLEL